MFNGQFSDYTKLDPTLCSTISVQVMAMMVDNKGTQKNHKSKMEMAAGKRER